jgi:1,4-dihydroxy-2-naphthoate octaprenyltransferase
MYEKLVIWIRVLRMFAFTATIILVTAGAVFAAYTGCETRWTLFPAVLFAALLYHGGVNLLNEYYDFIRGVDREGTFGSSGVLVQKLLNPKHVLWAGLGMLAAGTVIGIYFIWLRNWPILVIGFIGLAGAYGYTAPPLGLKYIGLGDISVFILMGPLMTLGSYFMVSGTFRIGAVLIGVPIGCLVAAILCANNLRDIRHDTAAGIRTTAILTGHRGAQAEYILLVCAAYTSIVLMTCTGTLPWWSLMVFAALPQGIVCITHISASSPGTSGMIITTDVASAKHHMIFGILLILSLIIGIIF